MKQIIPFKRELLFKTKVSEITSISLEHTLTLKNDDLISGEFHISGDYKMTEGSINRESFQFKLPFDIALDSRYDISSIIIDIDNFYYEIVNNESLQVNIDVYVEGKKIEDEVVFEKQEEVVIEEEDRSDIECDIDNNKPLVHNFDDDNNLCNRKNPIIDEVFEKKIEPQMPHPIILDSKEDEVNLFDNIDNSDTYVTYYVYMVKEEDTLDKILLKYQVTKEEVELYNDINDLKAGTKLIIPSSGNE